MGLKINCRNIFKGLQNDDNTFHKLCTNLQCYQLMYKCTSFTPVSLALGIMFAYLIGFKSTFYCFNLQIFNYQRAYSFLYFYFQFSQPCYVAVDRYLTTYVIIFQTFSKTHQNCLNIPTFLSFIIDHCTLTFCQYQERKVKANLG